MRSALIVLILMFGSQAGAECGNLCDPVWWKTATTADVQAELNKGADVMAREETGVTPLHLAAFHGTPVNIQALLAAGADVMARDETGWTPLHLAFGPAVNIEALLAAGADVMARNNTGQTPLHIIAFYDRNPSEKIQALVAAGADVMARDEIGDTALHRATRCGWATLGCTSGVIQTLLAIGANAKAKNKNSQTPWALAQENETLKGTKAYWALNDAQYN